MGGQEWPTWAKKHGWTVTYNQAVPPDQSQFTSSLQAVKASGADMLLVVLPPPAAIAADRYRLRRSSRGDNSPAARPLRDG
jgi:ABC-type sugar transport system substrate-binding protein